MMGDGKGFAEIRSATAKLRKHRNGIESKSKAAAVQIWVLRCNGMATMGLAGQSAAMVQRCMELHWHRKESTRRGIARRSGGRDMQTFAGAKHDYAKMSNGMARRRYAWCRHSRDKHWSRKPSTVSAKS